MANRFKQYSLDQQFLLPPSFKDWLPEGDLAYFIIDVVDELDLNDIYRYYQEKKDSQGKLVGIKAPSGQPAYHPKIMVALLLYAYCNGVCSSRRIARLCERDAGYRVITANQQPNFRTISGFRRIHLEALKGLFVQVLQLAWAAGLVKLGHVALDSTKVKANASKHKAMSYGRMLQREAEFERQVEQLLDQAQKVDEREDRLYGEDKRGDELPEELRFRQKRLQRIRQAKRALEQAARDKARRQGRIGDNDEPRPPRRGRPPKVPPGTPRPNDQYNFTDPDSCIMKMGSGCFDQAYNAQVAVDGHSQIIVAQRLLNVPNDKAALRPLVEQVKENVGCRPKVVSGDSGFYSEANIRYLRSEGIDDYVCADRVKHNQRVPSVRGRPPKTLSFVDRVRRKLWTKKGRATYAMRKAIVEPVFGQMKHARGLRQFLLRGIEKVEGEWSLWCTTHNLLKIWAAGKCA